jgi:hypothetical protein
MKELLATRIGQYQKRLPRLEVPLTNLPLDEDASWDYSKARRDSLAAMHSFQTLPLDFDRELA